MLQTYQDILSNASNFVGTVWEGLLFQHDCALAHKARSTKTWLEEFAVEELDCELWLQPHWTHYKAFSNISAWPHKCSAGWMGKNCQRNSLKWWGVSYYEVLYGIVHIYWALRESGPTHDIFVPGPVNFSDDYLTTFFLSVPLDHSCSPMLYLVLSSRASVLGVS